MENDTNPTTSLISYLKELGLSEYQSSAYIALLRRGTSTAKQASTEADIPQSRIYGVLEKLEGQGFVTIQPGRPKKYGPVDPERAIAQYTRHKRAQFDERINEVEKLGSEFLEETSSALSRWKGSDEMDIGWSYSEKEHIRELMREICERTESEIRMMTTAYSFRRLANHHKESFADRANEGVDIQILLASDEPLNDAVINTASEWADIRMAESVEGKIYLYDNEEIVLAYRTEDEDKYVGFTTRSPYLYQTLSHLFDLLWEQSSPLPA
ncbi:TrmB family transcription regulator (plasmid) [Haloferax gibbonsii]|jgi:sugar-specific transcriptional regulator TrmB|uniref:TrmB family transcription regulator n=1 Tax=Haloferax gibbonsii TaxID=35746 RepID=A0A871BKG8_HALGI|nr:TrmB family transcriptional regulator [Haloferax gibbonsii]QOS13571.1 TrmB family transcription regulator [Haloferax gibbonsii]